MTSVLDGASVVSVDMEITFKTFPWKHENSKNDPVPRETSRKRGLYVFVKIPSNNVWDCFSVSAGWDRADYKNENWFKMSFTGLCQLLPFESSSALIVRSMIIISQAENELFDHLPPAGSEHKWSRVGFAFAWHYCCAKDPRSRGERPSHGSNYSRRK